MRTIFTFLFLIFQFSSNFFPIFCDDLKVKSIFDKNLLKKSPHSQEILTNHHEFVWGKNRTQIGVLGFIDDDQLSYEKALIFAKKFNFLSPMWLNIQRTGFKQYKISGVDKIDEKWMKKLSEINSQIRITPRIRFSGWTMEDFLMLATSENEWIYLSEEILNFCKQYKIHGLVLDIFDDWFQKIPNDLFAPVIQEISARLRFNFLASIVLIPPKYSNIYYLNKDLFEQIADYASFITLMTLNYKSIASIEEYIKKIAPEDDFRHTIFTGVEFNGYETDLNTFSRKKLTKDKYLEYLNDFNGVLSYDEDKNLNYFDLKSVSETNKRIFYPSLWSINERINLANRLKIGIVVWMVGDGLDYFYELL